MRVEPVACLTDNYAYLVIDEARSACAAVDPSEAEPVLRAAERLGVRIEALWLTHHHLDHVGGVEALVDRLGAMPVLGSRHDLEHRRIPRQTRGLADGERFSFGEHEVSIRAVPGHTLGAITYVVAGWAFTGDTLFVAGCGRVFEGTMAQMADAMRILRELPADTRIACGHEYTVKNLEFARTIEPASSAVAHALEEAKALRAAGSPTVPSTIARERETNPFLRFDVDAIRRDRSAVESFEAIRRAKDAF